MSQLKFLLCNLRIKGCVRKDSPCPPCALSSGRCADWPNWSAPSAFATPKHVHCDGPFPIWSWSLLACRVSSCWTSEFGRVPPLMESPRLCSSAAGWRRRFPVGKTLQEALAAFCQRDRHQGVWGCAWLWMLLSSRQEDVRVLKCSVLELSFHHLCCENRVFRFQGL